MPWTYVVQKNEPQQAYFMIGYSIGFLTLLYEKTNDTKYLKCAKDYMNFALSCHEQIYSSNMSHKLVWSAALLLQYNDQSKEGLLPGSINSSYDHSAEVAYWFLEIVRILNQQAKRG